MPPEEVNSEAPLSSAPPPSGDAGSGVVEAPEAPLADVQTPEVPVAADLPEPAPTLPQIIEPPVIPSPPADVRASPLPEPTRPMTDYPAMGRQAKARKHEARLERVLAYVREKGKITNDEVQKLVRVSDATATRYLHELVKRGMLTKSGGTRSVVYKPN